MGSEELFANLWCSAWGMDSSGHRLAGAAPAPFVHI